MNYKPSSKVAFFQTNCLKVAYFKISLVSQAMCDSSFYFILPKVQQYLIILCNKEIVFMGYLHITFLLCFFNVMRKIISWICFRTEIWKMLQVVILFISWLAGSSHFLIVSKTKVLISLSLSYSLLCVGLHSDTYNC